MFHADTLYDNEENFGLPEIEERDLSASLTLRWSRKRKRWECRNAFFWQDAKNKWSCRSQDGRYYYGFRSLRALLKSYVGGLLCEKSLCYTTETRTRTVEVTLEDGTTSTEEEEYTVAVPVSLSQAYANLEAHLGREITDDDKSNIDHIYTMIAGSAGGGSYSGEYLRGDGSSIELDISAFTDPTTKNAADLVTYAIHAWESGWGYVWGTYGSVLTDSLFAYKLEQYPDGVGSYADFIRANWLGGRTTDCVGLIKGYGWLNPDTMTIEYGTNGMPDLGANQMYYNASVSGTIDTMPDIPGLAVWHDGHIGVYIGDGYVIEAMNTKKGVVKTKLEGRGWTHWLQIEYINYD